MKTMLELSLYCLCISLFISHTPSFSQDQYKMKLPEPQMTGGMPLMEALKNRHTAREFSSEKISMQVLSNLLWAAWGINRPGEGKRTAPSGMDRQEIEVYVSKDDGLFLYDAQNHSLLRILSEDIRTLTGTQEYVGDAALNIIYVADYSKFGDRAQDLNVIAASTTSGFIGQNVYLFCASEGLATVFRGRIDKEALAKKMGLRQNQGITYCQSVGYPKE